MTVLVTGGAMDPVSLLPFLLLGTTFGARLLGVGYGLSGLRAGFLAALSWGTSLERAAQVGCVLAAYVVETVGTQEYLPGTAGFVQRLAAAYGDDAAADVEPHIRCPRA